MAPECSLWAGSHGSVVLLKGRKRWLEAARAGKREELGLDQAM